MKRKTWVRHLPSSPTPPSLQIHFGIFSHTRAFPSFSFSLSLIDDYLDLMRWSYQVGSPSLSLSLSLTHALSLLFSVGCFDVTPLDRKSTFR